MIQFTGDPLDALLDVTAKYSLKASLAPLQVASSSSEAMRGTVPVDCLIHMTGRLTDPELTFRCAGPQRFGRNPESGGLCAELPGGDGHTVLVVVGDQKLQLRQRSENRNRNAAGAGVDFLTNQLSSLLTTERFSFVPKYTPGNDYYADEVGGSIYGELIKDRLIFEADMSYSTTNGLIT